ncbi:MAG: hypothetical protein IAA96_05200 [Spirochaetes bacterium]|uniref:DUF4390 domain-containing protein n=1 Tax=Candidatus Avitreponema avistercoris TaxID=2840705 RepID=A0A9D9EPS9_9SPIR|nr:hypothetical protein [Candidatus Avitreponema avistercoris]
MKRFQTVRLPLFAAAALLFAVLPFTAAGDSRIGPDAAFPYLEAYLEGIPFTPGEVYECSAEELREVLDLAAEIHINVFEIIDCFYRWITPRNIRIAIQGSDLRRMQEEFNLGGKRVQAILALENLQRLETGAKLSAGQEALDLYLTEPYEAYIEIGTAIYETRAGFRSVSPKLFDDAYGITVKKFFIKTPLVKLELFAPGKGAIYVKAISRPKRWNLDVVTKN